MTLHQDIASSFQDRWDNEDEMVDDVEATHAAADEAAWKGVFNAEKRAALRARDWFDTDLQDHTK